MPLTLADVYPAYSASAGWGDKGSAHDYLPVYAREMTRTENVTLLEVGVYHGHSLAMWGAWLTDSTVIGLDTHPGLVTYPDLDVRACNACDPEQVEAALGSQTFDYVIDDGSHHVHEQLATLDLLLPRVNAGGRYFIEDITGDLPLALICARLHDGGHDYDVYDGRGPDRQPDEIMVIVSIPEEN